MNTAAASVMSASASGPPILNRIRKTSAFLRKLSLNAEKNWHQNSGAKRRVNNKELVIEPALSLDGYHNRAKATILKVSRMALQHVSLILSHMHTVMAGSCSGHPRLACRGGRRKTRMPATSGGMTTGRGTPFHQNPLWCASG